MLFFVQQSVTVEPFCQRCLVSSDFDAALPAVLEQLEQK